jgi:hypothetical protein
MDFDVEFVARAFYDAEDDACMWDDEPEILKDEFRMYARKAIALLDEAREEAFTRQYAYAA